MILHSLYDLYDRLSTEPKYKIAPFGYSLQKITFRVVLKPDGSLHDIQSLIDRDTKRPLQLVVPGGDKPTGGVTEKSVHKKVQFLRNDLPFLVGITVEQAEGSSATKTTTLRVSRMQFDAFKEYHLALQDAIPDKEYQAVCRFLHNWNPEEGIKQSQWNWDEFASGQGIFQIIGKTHYINERPAVSNWWNLHLTDDPDTTRFITQCLITGKNQPIARLHEPKIKRVAGAQSSGSPIVSFDKSSDSFASYGHDGAQAFNAPVSKDATFRYATALNSLLDGPMSYKHRFTLGDATVVFWTKDSTNTEDIFARFASGNISMPASREVQDEAVRQKLELFLRALRNGRGAYPDLDEKADQTLFYLLGLTGQAKGRIGVRFFYRDMLSRLLDNLRRHYEDMKIVRQFGRGTRRPDPEFPSLWQILDETCPRRNGKPDRKHIPPILEGPLLRAVITGTLYPTGLFSAVMRRIHADREVNYIRACIIAGYLRRNIKKEVSMSLDKERKEPAYRLGRLFAVLEKVQGEALGKIGATIRDRFYSSASATPGVVFPRLLRTYQHHLSKLPEGLKINRERLVQEILDPVEDLPSHLGLVEQGLFALGYYHQAKDLWTAKDKKENQKGE